MRRSLLLCLLLVAASTAFGQHGMRLQNSYFLSGQPLFGAGYEYTQGDRFTYGLHLEFGRYAYQEQDMISSSWESYSLQGVALLPEVRFYPNLHPEDGLYPRGFFIGGFGHFRAMKEYSKEEAGATPNLRKGKSVGAGMSMGFRMACGDTPLSVEILGGYGLAAPLWDSPDLANDERQRAGTFDSAAQIFRLELGIGYRFGSKSKDEE